MPAPTSDPTSSVERSEHREDPRVSGLVASVALVGALALTACGRDNNDPGTAGGSSSSLRPPVDCPRAARSTPRARRPRRTPSRRPSGLPGRACADATSTTTRPVPVPASSSSPLVRSTSPVPTRRSRPRRRTGSSRPTQPPACGSPAWNLPMVTGPIAVAYNVKGVDKLVLDPRRRGQDLQRQGHDVERPGDRRPQLRCDPARPADQGLLPLRRVGHHGELHQVPQGRRARRLDRRARQEVGRQG